MNYPARDKIENASIRLMRTAPFYGSIVVSLKRVESRERKSMWTDGKILGYNPDFVDKIAPGDIYECDLKFVTAILAHEAAHVAAMHHLRMCRASDHEVANEAMDHVVNHILRQDMSVGMNKKSTPTFTLPDDALDDPRFHGMSTEEVYNTLMDEKRKRNRGSQPQGGGTGKSSSIGEVLPFPSPSGAPEPSDEELAEEEERQKRQNIQASDIAKMCSNESAGAERMVEEQNSAVVDWRAVLRRFVSDSMNKDDYSFKRPSRRASSDLILPSLYSPDRGRVIMCVDTSGSIGQGELNAAIAECLSCLDEYSESADVPQLPIVYCDSSVCGFEMLERYGTPAPKGGGGTDFEPAITFSESKKDELDLKAIVYFTDGCCSSFGNEPSMPVLWLLNSRNPDRFNPPFGEVAPFVVKSK